MKRFAVNPIKFNILQPRKQIENNQNDYSNDTSYLYAKNVSKALLEQTLNRIGGKYGASHLGTAAITGSGVVEDYLHGKTTEEILLNGGLTWGTGKLGQFGGKRYGLDPTISSILSAAIMDTINDKIDAEKEKREINFKESGGNK